jgi:hypothetical protein
LGESQKQANRNAESVGYMNEVSQVLANAFSVSTLFLRVYPGLKQPWATTSQRRWR